MSPRRQSLLLLLAWCVSLLLPAFHSEMGDAADAHGATEQACSGHFLPVAEQPVAASLGAACQRGADCPNPWHHHHSDSHHDYSQCPSCSSLLERVAETPVHFDFAPTRVERIAPRAVRVPPIAERLVVALARGPPSSPASS